MDWQTLLINAFKSLGIAGLITAAATYLIKSFTDKYFTNRSEEFKLKLSKELEAHKSILEIQNSKSSQLHERRLLIIQELYEKLVFLKKALKEGTDDMRTFFEKEGLEPDVMDEIRKSFTELRNYYDRHKIFFVHDTCRLIEKLMNHMGRSYGHIYLSRTKKDQEKSVELLGSAHNIQKRYVNPILESVEQDFRTEIGLLEAKPNKEKLE